MYKIISAEKAANILLPIVRRMRDFNFFFSIDLNEYGKSRELRGYFQFSFADGCLVQLKGESAVAVYKIDVATLHAKPGFLGHYQHWTIAQSPQRFFKSFRLRHRYYQDMT